METFPLRRARIQLRKAQAVFDEATKEYERRVSLPEGDISLEDLELSRLKVVQAECDRDLAKLDVEEASS